MEQQILFTQKKIVAQNTLKMKTEVHGFLCEVQTPIKLLTSYGEESGHVEYNEPYQQKFLITNSTQENMKATSELLNSVENQDLYLMVFEEDILPRNTRIKVFMQGSSYRQLEVRDNIKNEGTFVIHQLLAPCNNTVDETDPNIGLNIPVDTTNDNYSIGNNL
jgi:hypothetical protein